MHHSDDETFLVIGLLLAIAVGPYSTVMWWRIGAMVRGANRVPAPTDARAYPATSRAEPKPGLGASREGLVAKNSVTVGWKFLPFWGKIGFLVSYFFSWPTRVAWLPSWLKPFILIIWMMCICSVSVAFFVS